MIDDELRARILQANVELHAVEAVRYDELHGEIFNAWNLERIRRLVQYAKTLTAGRVALDLGAGTGAVSTIVGEAGFVTTAVDLSRQMLDRLEAKLARSPGLTVTVVHSEIIQFLRSTEQGFDLVVANSVLHHLPDYQEVVREIARRVRPGGVFLSMHEPNWRGSTWTSRRLSSVIARVDALFLPRLDEAPLDYSLADYHAVQGTYDSAPLLKLLESAGFRICDSSDYFGGSKSATLSRVANLAARVLVPLRTHSEFVVQKIVEKG